MQSRLPLTPRRDRALWSKRQQTASEEPKEIAWKAQHRLHKRYARLAATSKEKKKIVTAVGRELLGFIWAIGTKAESTARQRMAACLCDRLSRARDNSQRQLPTDQDYAVSTREYQTDQSSLKTAPTAVRSVLEKRQQQTHRLRRLGIP